MATSGFYTTPEWRVVRAQVLDRDGERCTVARLLGGACSGLLHVHHLEPVAERPDLALDPDNCGTACHRHHPRWEALRRQVLRARSLPPCRHVHRYPEGRLECERRRARVAA